MDDMPTAQPVITCCMYLSRLYLECHPTPLSSIHFLAYAYLRLSRKKSHELSFFSITPSYISIIDVTIKVCITRVGHKTDWAPSAPSVCFDPLKDLGGDIVKMYCKEHEAQQNCWVSRHFERFAFMGMHQNRARCLDPEPRVAHIALIACGSHQ